MIDRGERPSPTHGRAGRFSRRVVVLVAAAAVVIVVVLMLQTVLLSAEEQMLVGVWMMTREHADEDGVPGSVEYFFVFDERKRFLWLWRNPSTGAASRTAWTGRWSIRSGDPPELVLRGDRDLLERFFGRQDDAVHPLRRLTPEEFVWKNAEGPEVFRRVDELPRPLRSASET